MRIILIILISLKALPQVIFIELGAGSHNLFAGINFYYNKSAYKDIWTNINIRVRGYLYSLGPKKSFIEVLIAPKLTYLFGKTTTYFTGNFSYPEWNFIKNNEVFIKYNFFFDTRKTSQTTASVAVRINKFAIAIDNDVFAFTGEDKFRTGSLGVFWLDSLQYVAVKYLSFTGDPRPAPTHNPTEIYPREYKDLSNAPYGKFSNGIVCIEYSRKLLQFPYVRIGLDSERFRHFFQNKLVHDAPIIRNNNVHYPMLDIEGKPYLSDKQTLKPSKIHYEIGTNSYLFY